MEIQKEGRFVFSLLCFVPKHKKRQSQKEKNMEKDKNNGGEVENIEDRIRKRTMGFILYWHCVYHMAVAVNKKGVNKTV